MLTQETSGLRERLPPDARNVRRSLFWCFIEADGNRYPGVPVLQQHYHAALTPSHAGLTRHRFTAGKVIIARVEQ